MFGKKRSIAASVLFLLAITLASPAVQAKPSEYDTIVRHLQTRYSARKVRIPFMWLARFGVKIVRPAGVKSFNVTLFQDLRFSRETLDLEMQAAMRDSFGPEWNSVFRVRSRDGQQAYMYMREDGKHVKIALVTIDNKEAAVIRATFSPEKFAAFINNPKILGISLADDDKNDKSGRADSVDPSIEK